MKYQILKLLTVLIVFIACAEALGDCKTDFHTEGTLTINGCDPKVDKCIYAGRALYDYMEEIKDDDDVVTIAVMTSPWRLYDHEDRVIPIEDMAKLIKTHIDRNVKSVQIIGSWSGIGPNKETKSISEKLSESLGGFPVTGFDGFLWIKKDGSLYTTKQAFTIRKSKAYNIKEGEDVMVSLVAGWVVGLEDIYIKEKGAEGILRIGVAFDTFMLCEDRALEAFERAAELLNPIAAYNAAVIYIGRGEKEDLDTGIKLLNKAISLGDEKSKGLLEDMKEKIQKSSK